MYEQPTLRQIVNLLLGCIQSGADPDLPVGVHVGDNTAFIDTISVTDDDRFDVWIGATDEDQEETP